MEFLPLISLIGNGPTQHTQSFCEGLAADVDSVKSVRLKIQCYRFYIAGVCIFSYCMLLVWLVLAFEQMWHF